MHSKGFEQKDLQGVPREIERPAYLFDLFSLVILYIEKGRPKPIWLSRITPMNTYKNPKRKNIYDEYRRILKKASLSNTEIDNMRHHIRLLAQTVCEHVWKKKFY